MPRYPTPSAAKKTAYRRVPGAGAPAFARYRSGSAMQSEVLTYKLDGTETTIASKKGAPPDAPGIKLAARHKSWLWVAALTAVAAMITG